MALVKLHQHGSVLEHLLFWLKYVFITTELAFPR